MIVIIPNKNVKDKGCNSIIKAINLFKLLFAKGHGWSYIN